MKLKFLFTISLMLGIVSGAFAVTDGEMEQARTITAKNYLRWANNGSGYLDELKETPKSIAELKKVLKPKELENLKAFEKIAVPRDYASWDKDKLVAYWSETFLSTPGLDEQGSRSRSRTAKALKDLKVSAPQKDAPAPEAAEHTPLANAEAAQEAGPVSEGTDPVADEIAGQMAAADSVAEAAIDEIAENDEVKPKKSNATWIYVGILIFLVIVVVCLVIYAARSMKSGRGNDPDDSDELGGSSSAPKEHKEQAVYSPGDTVDRKEHEFMIERKNEKIRKVKAELDVVREENARLQAAHDALQTRLNQAQTQIESLRLALGEAGKKPAVRSLYLGRVNRNGLFVRADRQLNPDATVYRLESEDGYTGTFRVVNNPAVTERALENPVQWLEGGCTAADLEDTDGFTEIVTETSGTAVLEDGCWKMVRKARIKYS